MSIIPDASERVRTVADALREYRHCGCELAPQAVRVLVEALDLAADDIAVLEHQPMPPQQRATAVTGIGNVVPFRRHPRPPLRPVPGGAA